MANLALFLVVLAKIDTVPYKMCIVIHVVLLDKMCQLSTVFYRATWQLQMLLCSSECGNAVQSVVIINVIMECSVTIICNSM